MRAACELLEEGIVGVLGPLTEDNSNVVQSILDLKEVPHIEVSLFHVCVMFSMLTKKKCLFYENYSFWLHSDFPPFPLFSNGEGSHYNSKIGVVPSMFVIRVHKAKNFLKFC